MTSSRFDVVIVGAGIVGASVAWECARAGLRVAVADAGEVAGGTTATNMGQVLVEDGSEPEFALTKYSVRLWHELRPELPPEAEYSPIGTVWIAQDEPELQVAERRHQFYRTHGVPSELWDAEALHREEPRLRKGLAGGLLLPDDVVVTAPPIARMLLERVRQAGGIVMPHRPVRSFSREEVRLAGDDSLHTAHIVNAAGVSAPTLSPGVPVRPRKGHLVHTDPRPGVIRHQLLEIGYVRRAQDVGTDSISFNVQPRPTGEIRIGSSRQLDRWDRAPDPQVIRDMVARAEEYLPSLSGYPLGPPVTGLRPASSDGLPLIGPWPPQPGVWLATGHEGLGITMSLATGRLVADGLTGRPSEIPLAPYLPRRVLAPGSRGRED